MHPDEIKFASDEERVKRYAQETGLSEEAARQELLRTAASMVDNGWNNALSEQDGNTAQAASFLRAELANNQSNLFQVTLAEYNNERLGLKELLNNRDALDTLLKEVALVDPFAYKTDPKYFQEVLNAKGLGSQEGFGNAVEDTVAGPSKAAMWLMGAANCPSCALTDIQNAWESVQGLPEELSYKAYLDNLHIMQGKGAEVVQSNEASATATGVGVGLAASGGLLSGTTKGGTVGANRIFTIADVAAPNLASFEAKANVLNTFKGGNAVETTYGEGTRLYRIGDRNGAYWATEPPPATELQWRMDYAVQGEWNNMSNLYTMDVPKGSSLSGLEGIVGAQRGALYGGKTQVFIDWKNVPEDWITTTPLKEQP